MTVSKPWRSYTFIQNIRNTDFTIATYTILNYFFWFIIFSISLLTYQFTVPVQKKTTATLIISKPCILMTKVYIMWVWRHEMLYTYLLLN